jgi:hypothetical protein
MWSSISQLIRRENASALNDRPDSEPGARAAAPGVVAITPHQYLYPVCLCDFAVGLILLYHRWYFRLQYA